MKIKNIVAREIFDARGMPTIECCVQLENSAWFSASVPAGVSKGSFEAHELRDGGERAQGLGVTKAIAFINSELGPLFIGQEPDCIQADFVLLERDGSPKNSGMVPTHCLPSVWPFIVPMRRWKD